MDEYNKDTLKTYMHHD